MNQLGVDWEEIDNQYRRRLCSLVEREMNARYRRREDPEDVVQSVFRTFFRRVAGGEYQVEDPNALWALLKTITRRKILRHVEYHGAEKRRLDAESSQEADSESQDDASNAEARLLGAVLETVLNGLEPPEPQVLSLQLNGYTISEIVDIVRQGLDDPYLQILQMRLQGLKYAEISENVGLTQEQVRYRIERIIERLRVSLK